MALQKEEEAHELRDEGDLYKQKKARGLFPLEASARNKSADILMLAQWDGDRFPSFKIVQSYICVAVRHSVDASWLKW